MMKTPLIAHSLRATVAMRRWHRLVRTRLLPAIVLIAAQSAQAQQDDTDAVKDLLRRANGGVASLKADTVYHVIEKLQLSVLCPAGVTIEGNGAVIKALPGFRQGVLLTATELLRSEPYDPGVTIHDLTIDGDGHVSRCIFGNWKNASIHDLQVKGGTVYQVNAIWNDSTLSNIRVTGSESQTNNGFDCNLQNSTIWNISVDMQGNLKESGLWLNGSNQANIINSFLTDGRTAFGLENCKDVNLINMNVRGAFSFRVINILPAEPSERIHLYDVKVASKHVGKEASAGVHFNATQGGMVVRGQIVAASPGVMVTNGASDIDVIDVVSPAPIVHPKAEWIQTARHSWISKARREQRQRSNKPPVVYAGLDQTVNSLKRIKLTAAVADERNLSELTVAWSKASGPGKVAFRKPKEPQTTINVSKPGIYRLRLTVNDGELESMDELTITARAK